MAALQSCLAGWAYSRFSCRQFLLTTTISNMNGFVVERHRTLVLIAQKPVRRMGPQPTFQQYLSTIDV